MVEFFFRWGDDFNTTLALLTIVFFIMFVLFQVISIGLSAKLRKSTKSES